MTRVLVDGIEIEYESMGDKTKPTILLIMGLGGQLTLWPDEFCDLLVSKGFHVIRFDNRDVGLSTHLHEAGPVPLFELLGAISNGETVQTPYELSDMVVDAIGILDAEGIEKAHIVGVSMGGMIGQLLAATYPERTFSFTSIMSSTGNPDLPPSTPEAFAIITAPQPDPNEDLDAYVNHMIQSQRVVGSPAFPADIETLRQKFIRNARRSYNREGVGRQLASIIVDGDRRPRIRNIKAPVVVIHGDADPLVPLEAGKDTAKNIPNAELRIIKGMGHDLPEPLFEQIIAGIMRAIERSQLTKG